MKTNRKATTCVNRLRLAGFLDDPITPFADGRRPVALPAPAPEPAKEAEGRDRKGKFVKGWKGGPGNPFARKVAKLRAALLDAVGEDDVAAVARKLVLKARGGNTEAAKLLLSYVVGRPAEAPDPDRADLDELRLARELPTPREVASLTGRLVPEDAAALHRLFLTVRTKTFFRNLNNAVKRGASDEELAALLFGQTAGRAAGES